MVSFVKISSQFLVAFIKPSGMLENIYTGINSRTEDVVSLDECTGYPCVQQRMQLQPSQLKKNILQQEGDGDNQKYGEVTLMK